MVNKTSILIVILFLITCGLLYLAIATTPAPKKETAAPTPTPISVNAKTSLSLISASASESSRTADYTIDAVVDTKNNINAVQLELGYDPQKVTNVTLSPGPFFKQPSVLLKSIDTANGRISYALTEQIDLPGKSGKGTVAYISFNLAPFAKMGDSTTITILPKSAVTADKILESVLKETNNITLPLPTGIPTAMPLQQGTPSAK